MTTPFRDVLTQALRTMRNRRELTTTKLGERIGIDHSSVVRVERRGANPRATTVDRQLKGMRADVGELIETMQLEWKLRKGEDD